MSPAQRSNFLIDCGASSLPAMKRLGIAREPVDLILITHFHGDHFGGLPFFLLDAQFSRRSRPLIDRRAARDRDAAEEFDGSDVRAFVEDAAAL